MNDTPSRVVDDAPPPTDENARAEAAELSTGKLKRDETWRRHLHVGGLLFFWFAMSAIFTALLVWLFNLLTPDKWHFLSDPEKFQLQNLLITALGSSLLTDYGKRVIGRLEK